MSGFWVVVLFLCAVDSVLRGWGGTRDTVEGVNDALSANTLNSSICSYHMFCVSFPMYLFSESIKNKISVVCSLPSRHAFKGYVGDTPV